MCQEPTKSFPEFPREIAKLGTQVEIPSGKLTVCYWKWPFIVSFPIKIVIIHSYVSLPEGM